MMMVECNDKSLLRSSRGFTLVELLVTLAIVGLMMTAVYAVHLANVRAVRVEEDRVAMQQDQRIAVDFMARSLRTAGYDKTDIEPTLVNPDMKPSIKDARSNFIYFVSDLNDDGFTNGADEHVAFCVFNSNTGLALSYITGTDNSVGQGTPTNADGPVPIAHVHAGHVHEVLAHIEALEFYYTLADGTQTTDPDFQRMDDIRSVEVSLLSRATDPDTRWVDNQVYVPASGTAFNGGNPYGDNIRRRLIRFKVFFRNMGL